MISILRSILIVLTVGAATASPSNGNGTSLLNQTSNPVALLHKHATAETAIVSLGGGIGGGGGGGGGDDGGDGHRRPPGGGGRHVSGRRPGYETIYLQTIVDAVKEWFIATSDVVSDDVDNIDHEVLAENLFAEDEFGTSVDVEYLYSSYIRSRYYRQPLRLGKKQQQLNSRQIETLLGHRRLDDNIIVMSGRGGSNKKRGKPKDDRDYSTNKKSKSGEEDNDDNTVHDEDDEEGEVNDDSANDESDSEEDEEELDDSSYEDDLEEQRDLEDMNFSDTLQITYYNLFEKESEEGEQSEFEKIVIDYIPLLQTINDENKLRKVYQEFRKKVKAALDNIDRGHLINMGDNLNKKTLLLITLHFATEAEANIAKGGDKLSKMNYKKSACIRFVKEYIASSIVRQDHRLNNNDNSKDEEAKESLAREYWEEVKKDVIKRITTIDHRFFISENKDKFEKEVKKVAEDDNTSTKVLDLIGVINASFHNLYFNLHTNGERLSSIIASTHVFDVAYDREVNTQASVSNIHGYISHSETFLAGYIQNPLMYDDELLEYFDGVINGGFGKIFQEVLKKKEGYVLHTNMATRFGRNGLSDEEREKLAQYLLEIRVRGGTTSARMRELVFAIINHLKSTGKTVEEAIAMIPEELEQLRQKYNNNQGRSDNNDKTFAAYKKLVKQQSKKQHELLEKLAKKLVNLYKGSETAGLMKTLASIFFGQKDYQLDYDSSKEQILEHLQMLHANKSKDNKEGNELQNTYNDLVKHQPDISEDFDSLASYIFKVTFNSDETYKRNVDKMRKYINEHFKEDDITFVRQTDNNALYHWWATITGYKEFKGKVPSLIGKKAYKGSEQRTELEKIGVCFNIDKVIEAIDKARQAREESRRKKLGSMHDEGVDNMAKAIWR